MVYVQQVQPPELGSKITPANHRSRLLVGLVLAAVLLGALYVSGEWNYLLFHSLAELVGIVIAVAIFLLAMNTWHITENGYLQFVGIAYLFIALVDIAHMLAYKGMGVFPGYGTNLPTQLWIAGRYLESLALLIAPLLVARRFHPKWPIIGFALATAGIIAVTFVWRVFPACYVEGAVPPLTPFKITSEYLVSGLLLLALFALWRKRRHVGPSACPWLAASLVLAIAAGICFTEYVSVYGRVNLVGHLLKLISYFCVYKAIIETGLVRPYELIFRSLKEREEALAESEARFRTLAEHAPDLIMRFDRALRHTFMSPAITPLTGRSAEWYLGKTHDDLGVAEPLKSVWQARLRSIFETGQAATMESDFPTAGGVRILQGILVPEFSAEGAVESVLCIARDITELREALRARDVLVAELQEAGERLTAQTEELQAQQEELQAQNDELARQQLALLESEERYRTTFEHAAVGIAVVGLSGEWLRVNDSLCELLGYAREELTTLTFQDLTHPDDLESDLAYVEQLRIGAIEQYRMEKRYRRKDGAIVWGNLTGSALRNADGTVRHFVAIIEDITEQVQARLRIAQLVRVQEEERALLSSAIELLPLPISVIAANGETMRENAATRALLGEAASETRADVAFLTPDTRTLIPPSAWPAQRALHGEAVTAQEGLLRLPDNHEMPVLAHAAPVYVRGDLHAAIVALQDISALKAADRAKDEFLAVLSHELLSPTTSMLGWSQVAQEWEMPDRIRQALVVIERNAHRQKELIDDLLDMSRIIHGKIALNPEPADLWQLAAQQAESVAQAAQASDIALCLEPAGEALPVHADPVRIGQVVSNLLNNALKFTPAGGAITVRGYRQAEWALLEIRDTGKGIPPERIPQLFGRFQQLQRDERTGGLGLGLALVKGLVELHGGHVAASSPGVQQGSTFTIALPTTAQRSCPADAELIER